METNDISTCEKLVMKVIWDSAEDLALQEIMDKVNNDNGKNWKPQTVSTFLARLVKKEFLTVYRKGRYTYYVPAVSKADFWKATMEENAAYFAQGDMSNLACALCKDMLDEEQRREVKEEIDKL